ncbi:hypothetical protein LIER_17138 [Lithospermum erythrorhizon]|uniref:Uncharacterized protein n=1 Tax=Lithospermum erythrorhizon TaxID=34254 RepID=A0AAV3QDK4_LITER
MMSSLTIALVVLILGMMLWCVRGHNAKSGVQSAMPYGNRLGRKEMVSKIWKAKRQVPDRVQNVSHNFLQPGDSSTSCPEEVAVVLHKEQVTRLTVEQYSVTATDGKHRMAEPHGILVQIADLRPNPEDVKIAHNRVINSELHTPRLRLPKIATSVDNGLTTGQDHMSLMSDEDDGQKRLVVNDFLHYVTALQLKIDQADNTVIDRIRKSPSTSEFLKKKIVSNAYLEEAKAWIWDHGTKEELCDKSAPGKQGQHNNAKTTWADLVEAEELQQVVQKDQPREQRNWSTTVQVAQIGEATGIVKAALKQLNGADGLRGQRLSFDDKG